MSKVIKYAVGVTVSLIALGFILMPVINAINPSIIYSNGSGDWQSLDMADDHVISLVFSSADPGWSMSVDGDDATLLKDGAVIYSDNLFVEIHSYNLHVVTETSDQQIDFTDGKSVDIHYAATGDVQLEVSGDEAVFLTAVSALIVPGPGDYARISTGYITEDTVIYAAVYSAAYPVNTSVWAYGTPASLTTSSSTTTAAVQVSDYDSNGVATAGPMTFAEGGNMYDVDFLVPAEITIVSTPAYIPLLLILPILIILAAVVWGLRVISGRDD